MAASVATIGLGGLLHARCVGLSPFKVPLPCYSDIAALYSLRGFDRRAVPYVESFNEYPPVTGMWQYATSFLATDQAGYWLANAVLLGLVGLAMTWLLWRMARGSPWTWVWALGSPLLLYSSYNWDLLAVLLATMGLRTFLAGMPAQAAVLMGLGAAAKWYPAVMAGALAAVLLRRSWLAAASFAAASLGAFLAAHLPFLVLRPDLVLETYRFHLDRDANWETPWTATLQVLQGPGPELVSPWWVGPALTATMAAGLLVVAWLAWRGRLQPVAACAAALLVFLLANKVFSVQYVLWLLPFLVLLRVPLWLTAALFVCDVFVLSRVTELSLHVHDGAFAQHYGELAPWVYARHAVLAMMLAWLAWRRPDDAALPPTREPAPRPAPA